MPKETNKTKRWDPVDMEKAIVAVREKRMGFKKAADVFNVPKTTLFRLYSVKDIEPKDVVDTTLGRRPILPHNLEIKLVEYLKLMEAK